MKRQNLPDGDQLASGDRVQSTAERERGSGMTPLLWVGNSVRGNSGQIASQGQGEITSSFSSDLSCLWSIK
jgi:hypothetical protein